MSGTNQSKLVKEQEKIYLGDTNNLNTCISTKDKDVTAENSNTENHTLQDDTEGNLQLQIQEAIAATISRASRKSAAFEQQQMNSSNSCTSTSASENALDFESSSSEDQVKLQNEVLRNIETCTDCESNDPVECDGIQFKNLGKVQNTPETNLQTQDLNDSSNRKILGSLIQNKDSFDEPKDANQFDDYTACNSSVDNVQNKQDMQEKKQGQERDEASNSEVSSKEDMLVDSKQEQNLNHCSSNSLDRDNSIGVCNNEEDGQNISEENLQVQEVDVSDSRESVLEDDLNNCVYNSRSKDNVIINVESSRTVADTIAEHIQTLESVSSHSEDDHETKPTANSAENPGVIEDAPQVENNADYVDSEEPTEDLLVDKDQTSCSKTYVDIENLEVQHASGGAQKIIDVSDSETFTDEDLPIENEQKNTSNNCISNVDNTDISNKESSLERQFTSEKTLKAQEAVSITSNEICSNKDFPEREAENPKRKVTEAPDTVIAESQPENLNHTILKMEDKDVFSVIEIVEEGSGIQKIAEVIDVDESKVIKTKQANVSRGLTQNINVSESKSQNPYIDGACIEILSDEDEVQVQEKVEQNSKVQQIAKVDAVEIPKNRVEDILQQVKMLTSTEYLLFYLKLPPKCDDETSTGNLSDRLGSKFENGIVIPAKNKLILKAIDASIRETSKNTVQNIVNRVKDLTIREYLWFRSNLPTDCINPNLQHCILPRSSEASRTILWLKSHLEESPDSMLLKHDVFNKYQAFCNQTDMQLMAASRFGKLMNQVFPNIGRKRLRVRGNSAYYYVGLQPRIKLDSPRLPKLSEKLQQKRSTDENESVNKSEDVRRNNQFNGPTISLNGLNNSYTSNQRNESDDSYKSNQLNGQTILVHDPLALLNMSTNDDKLHNDASFHQSYDQDTNNISKSGYLDKNLKISRSSYRAGPKLSSLRSRNSTSVINRSVCKIKYKEYRHPSVRKVFKEFNTIVLPPEVFKLNINPSVALDNSEINNWYAEHIKAFAEKLSNIVIRKEGRSQNFNVLFTCCSDVFEVSDSYAKQLNDLKENLSNITVRKSNSSSNYEVVRTSSNVLPEESCTASKPFRITKQLANHKIRSDSECAKSNVTVDSAVNIHEVRRIKHLSVQRLYKKFKGIALPEEVFKTDIDPVIILDSGEVIEWYIKQVDYLKHTLSNVKDSVNDSTTDLKLHVVSPIPSVSSFRHSKAKMMNFCEIDSSDYDSDNTNMEENHPMALGEKNSDFLQTGIENTMVSISSDCKKINVSEISHQIVSDVVNEPVYTCATIENEQQRLCTRQKRSILNDEDANEIEQKRKKFYCSKIIISPNHKANICEQPLSSSTEQIPYFQEKSIEQCSSPISDEVEGFVCKFCFLVFNQRHQFIYHKKIHLYCKSCKRKLKSFETMRLHLINHCSLNSIKNKPVLKLRRVDSVPSIVKKYARAFSESVVYAIKNSVNHKAVIAKTATYITNKTSSKSCTRNVLRCTPNGILSLSATNLRSEGTALDKSKTNLNQLRTYSKLPRCTTVRILKSASKANTQIQTPVVSMASTVVSSENQQELIQHQTQQEPTFQLKNTISNNLNKILLLSNSGPQSQIQSPNILYGTLFVNNTSGQSSPNVCLNSSLYNPTVTASGIDCALNTNPSCSNPDLQQPATFMQIVESPNTSVMQYAAPVSQNNTLVTFEQHQDHSYHQQQHQQQLFHVGNNISNINNIVFVSNNVPQITELRSATVSTPTNFTPFFGESAKTSEVETTNYLLNETETSNVDNPPPQGQFRIRVKSLQELR